MKTLPALRPLTLSVLLTLAPVGATFAQTAAPGDSVSPAPSAAVASPAPNATVAASSPSASAAPQKPKLSPAEKKARRAERLRKYDANKDGKLDEKERAAMRAGEGLAPITDDAAATPTPKP